MVVVVRICAVLLLSSLLIDGEAFTSTTHLTQLLKTEVVVAKKLEAYLKKEYERLDQVER